jgi:GH24 family phage-related lysozyme (muramidase)
MPDTISDDAFDLIVREEDSDQAYYTRHYQHFEWPQGASGPTIGIGYDCGYVTPAEASADWSHFVPHETVIAIQRACGKTGGAAHIWVETHGNSVTVPWDIAIQQFRERELPKWIAHVREHLPNTDELSADSLGALVSLAYNRGPSFDSPGGRYAEMRAIKAHMVNKEFALIPQEFLRMRRLWPVNGDLWKRRTHEAALFERGLQPPPSVPLAA